MTSSKRRSSSTSTSLPLELVEEILCRTLIESLVRFKSTCKQWYTLLNDKRFIYKHLLLSQEEKRFIQFDRKSIQLFKPETTALLRLPIPDELHDQVAREITHCDGLLMLLCKCSERGMFTNRKLAVWNPFLSRVKWIEPSVCYSRLDVYGFGYDNLSRDNYKILRIKMMDSSESSSETEIYEFRSKLWRSVDATLGCNVLWKPLSMNGNMYWTAQKKMVNSGVEIFIQSFDFSTETFKPICCLPKVTADALRVASDHTVVLSGFGGDRLSLLHQHKESKIEVWITNKVTDGVVSWSKHFGVTRPDLPVLYFCHLCGFPTYSTHKTNKITLWCEELDSKEMCMYAHVYEMSEGEISTQAVTRRRETGRGTFHSSGHVYVPSLVPVPE